MHDTWVKVCGLTRVDEALDVVAAGADAIGINLWPGSPRGVDLATACRIRDAVAGRITLVAVTVDMSLEALGALQQNLRPDWLQLHGAEPDAWLTRLGPQVYRAIGLGDGDDVQRAIRVAGPWVLIDARDEVQRGGTGMAPPASLALAVCAARHAVLAGGLSPSNVAAAVAAFRPYGVDAASGLEFAPGRKDIKMVEAFVRAAKKGVTDV